MARHEPAGAASGMTYAQYLELERASEAKHEYLCGEVFAMAGGSPEHARLAANLIRELGAALRGRPCAVFTSDARVRIEATEARAGQILRLDSLDVDLSVDEVYRDPLAVGGS